MATMLETVDVPTIERKGSGRPKEPNPFIDGEYGDTIRGLRVITDESSDDDKKGAAKALFVPGIKDTKQNKEFAKVTVQLREAGAARDVTIRQTYSHHRVGTVDGVLITFWAIPKIVRKTKAEIEAERAAAAESAVVENEIPEPNVEADEEVPAPKVVTRGTTRKTK